MDSIFKTEYAVRAANSILHDIPVAASWFITNRCNYKCDFCSYPTFNNKKEYELTPADLDKVGGKLADVGVAMIAMIGGEPFVRRDIYESVEALSKHLLVQVTTNGWFVDEEAARKIFATGVYMVNVSLDSSDPEEHNRGRGNPKAYEKAIRAVKNLRDAPKIGSDQRTGFESILSGRNVSKVEEMVDLADSLGVQIVFQPYSAGHTKEGVDEMSRMDVDTTELFTRLKGKSKALYNSQFMINEFTPYFRNGRMPDCQAGRTYFNIDSYGYITRCEEQTKRYGNLKDLSPKEIKESLKRIQADTKEDGCDTCYLRTRGETEPLYQDNFENLLKATEEMFGVELPPIIPRIARVPGMKKVAKAGLGIYSRLTRKPR